MPPVVSALPNIAELAANGVHEGTIKYEYGNNNLKPEVSTQVDGGVEFNTQHVSLSANVFYNHISDFIFSAKLLSTASTILFQQKIMTKDSLLSNISKPMPTCTAASYCGRQSTRIPSIGCTSRTPSLMYALPPAACASDSTQIPAQHSRSPLAERAERQLQRK